MIPRTKVNYFAHELLRAMFLSEEQKTWRQALTLKLKEIFGFEHLVLTPSGRSALYFLLKAMPQKRVIVPAYTCKAVVEAAKLAKKEVLHVEVENDGFNMDASLLEPLLDKDCIVIATHQFGIPCDIERIHSLCEKHGASMVEDVAAAFGTRIGGKLAGTFGEAAFFSFDSTKLINVPLKAGFLAIQNAKLFDSVQTLCTSELKAISVVRKTSLIIRAFILLILEQPLLYRVFHKVMFEWRGTFTADGPRLNLQLTAFYRDAVAEWQAFLAMQQLQRLDSIITHRREVYSKLRDELQSCRAFDLPPEDKHREWACIRFPIRVHGDKLAFYQQGTAHDIDFAFSFTFIDCPEQMQNARKLADSVLDLPYYTKLSVTEMNRTIQVMKEIGS